MKQKKIKAPAPTKTKSYPRVFSVAWIAKNVSFYAVFWLLFFSSFWPLRERLSFQQKYKYTTAQAK
ncbi:hypothetical protein O4H26_05480 [Aequorivita viscosa]|nr:hypothetical protein [Aequorivita viscosa]